MTVLSSESLTWPQRGVKHNHRVVGGSLHTTWCRQPRAKRWCTPVRASHQFTNVSNNRSHCLPGWTLRLPRPFDLGRLSMWEPGTNSSSSHPGDFRGWRTLKQQPCKLTDNLKVDQGLVPVGASREGLLIQEPFQSVTSYRSQYIRHPLQKSARSGVQSRPHHF